MYHLVFSTVLNRSMCVGNILKVSVNQTLANNVRHKSKRSGGSSRNKYKATDAKFRGLKYLPGDYVEKGAVLFFQYGLKWYPGENVAISPTQSLYALESGEVIVSSEQLSPFPDSPLYPATLAGRKFYRNFVHVIPEPQEQCFKLVSQT